MGHRSKPSIASLLSLYRAPARPRRAGPTVAVVGAGLAGLTATYLLHRAGVPVRLFEADVRVGGRVRTDFGELAPGVVCEWGGEFIDSTHHDVRALARWCGLTLIDTAASAESRLDTLYHFGGQSYAEPQILAACAEVAPRIAADAERLSADVSWRRHTALDVEFDRLSVEEYLAGLEMEPWLRSLLGVAYTTEFGTDIGLQSSINFLSMIGTDLSRGFEIFGASDERYKVREGLERITQSLAAAVAPCLRLESRLVSLGGSDGAWRLGFDRAGGAFEADAQAVVLALPFTLLRQVRMEGVLPAAQSRCIDELGYGSNAKLLIATRQRVWRGQGFDGGLYTDLAAQTGWDGSRLREGHAGIYTCFLGGAAAERLGEGPVQPHAERICRELETVYPGFQGQVTGRFERAHWPTEPFALGSYSAYRTGQWTTLAGLEGRRAGSLWFAGEHCSRAFQGYMNGAVETGRRAAGEILQHAF